jgi:predicted DNA-binding transcriptional regulator YafY
VRADRLVAILLLLQTRGQVTAAEVAAELEVSERTARRDLDALGMAGIPIYSQQGRNGGWRLLGGGSTDLTGLTADEARALFLVAGPSSSATPEVRAALRKLMRALPEPFRVSAERAAKAVIVDPSGWHADRDTRPPPPFLDALQQAVVEGEQQVLGYVSRDRTPSTRVVHPLGLASKGSSWYLVADTEAGMRTFRVDRVTSLEGTGEAVVPPDGFDLQAAWTLVTDEVGRHAAPARARGTASPGIVPILRMNFGTRMRIGPPGPDGRVEIELSGPSLHVVAAMLAGYGADVELIDPPEVRDELAAIAAELVGLYGPGGS